MVIVALIGRIASASPDVSTNVPGAIEEPAKRGERETIRRGFEVRNGGLKVSVILEQAAPPQADAALSGRLRACPVTLEIQDGAFVPKVVESCHPLAQIAIERSLNQWVVETDGPIGADRVIGELIYVFGREGTLTNPRADLYVVPQAATRFVVNDRGIFTFAVRPVTIKFPVYPTQRAPNDTRRPDCDVRVEIDPYGAPERIEVTSCDPVFVAPTLQAFEKWTYGEYFHRAVPYRVVRFRSRFFRPATLRTGNVQVFGPGSMTFVEQDSVKLSRAEVTDTLPKPLRGPPPKLSKQAQASLRERVVCRFDVWVNDKGKPGGITPLQCPDTLIADTTRALKRWRWTPATADGQPVAAQLTVNVRIDPAPK
ncbi:MAG: energy transducer TonB [Myxococcota bacterium]